jgi:hypothetical protein
MFGFRFSVHTGSVRDTQPIMLCALVIAGLGRRELVWVNVTAHPTVHCAPFLLWPVDPTRYRGILPRGALFRAHAPEDERAIPYVLRCRAPATRASKSRIIFTIEN